MKIDSPAFSEDRLDVLFDVIRKHKHIIIASSNDKTGKKTLGFNSHVVISESIDFLEAIRKKMGGEIINNKTIGAFLYFD